MAIAHRGANYLAPENSLEAFKIAESFGFTNFELDVQCSKDGVLFVCHDDNLERLTGERRFISKLSSIDIKTILTDGKEFLLQLPHGLEEFPKAQFNIDAKTWRAANPLCNLLNSLEDKSRFCIGGFSDFRTGFITKRTKGAVCHSLGPVGVSFFYICKNLNIFFRFSAGCIQIPHQYFGVGIISKNMVKFAHRLGLHVHVWTVNDETEMNNLIDIGVDGLMTDDCLKLKKVLEARGMWNK